MGGYSSSSGGSPGSGGTKKQAKNFAKKNKPTPIRDFITGGGVTGAIIRGVKKAFDPKRNRKSKSGDVYAYDEAKEKIDYKAPTIINNNDRDDNQPKGIELAKASTGSATILGPAEIQKTAANNVKGPATTEMSADQISLANKRKGRKVTNITNKKTLAKNYKLSEKSLLG